MSRVKWERNDYNNVKNSGLERNLEQPNNPSFNDQKELCSGPGVITEKALPTCLTGAHTELTIVLLTAAAERKREGRRESERARVRACPCRTLDRWVGLVTEVIVW